MMSSPDGGMPGNSPHGVLNNIRRRISEHRTEWLRRREEALGDLRRVGPDKPLGYLRMQTLTMMGASGIGAELRAAGKKVIWYTPGRIPTPFSGLLFAYDEVALADLLKRHREVLEEAGWSTEPAGFVEDVYVRIAPSKTKLFDVVADAFADYTNPGRTDVESEIELQHGMHP